MIIGASTDPNWTDIASVAIVAGQLVVLLAAAIFAARQVAEARRLREQQNRPFVVIDFDVDSPWIFLSVSNVGTSLARDVRFEITPELTSSLDDAPDLRMLTDGISTLPPGKVFRTFFDGFIQRGRGELPDQHSAQVTYTDESGRRKFDERLDLDLGLYRDFSDLVKHDVHDVHKVLQDILAEMKKWTSGTGRGVYRLGPEEVREEVDRRRAEIEEFRRTRQPPAEPELPED